MYGQQKLRKQDELVWMKKNSKLTTKEDLDGSLFHIKFETEINKFEPSSIEKSPIIVKPNDNFSSLAQERVSL